MKQLKTIQIKCETKDSLELAEMTELQGGLKIRDDIDYDKIELSILKYGFSFPFFIWKSGKTNYLLDGHGRFEILCRMQKDGFIIPPLPVVYVQAKTKKEAKEKLLRLNSTFGKMTKESVLEFAEDIDLNFDEFRNLITWDKGNGQGQNSEDYRMYAIADEKCLFIMAGVQGFNTNADNYFENWEPIRIYLKQERDRMGWSNADMKKMCGHSPTSGCHWFDKSQWIMPTEEEYKIWQQHAKGMGFKKEYEEVKKEYEEIKKEYYSTRAYFDNTHDNMNNVWHFKRTGQEERQDTGGHATPKPIELCSRAINTSSRVGELVLDLFGGSGSTLIACEKTNRKCRIMELDERYCDVIRRRYTKWAKENGKPITSGCLE